LNCYFITTPKVCEVAHQSFAIMPLRTRSGKDYDTRGEDKWYEPHRVTKPTKDDEDRAAMALFVVDQIPLDVSQGSAGIVERHAEYQRTED
jgi:hypothetical protein